MQLVPMSVGSALATARAVINRFDIPKIRAKKRSALREVTTSI
jgi:hypothetical protein